MNLDCHVSKPSFGRPRSRIEAGVNAAIYPIRTPALMHAYTPGSILLSSPEILMQASSISTNGHCLCKAPGYCDELSLLRFLIEPP